MSDETERVEALKQYEVLKDAYCRGEPKSELDLDEFVEALLATIAELRERLERQKRLTTEARQRADVMQTEFEKERERRIESEVRLEDRLDRANAALREKAAEWEALAAEDRSGWDQALGVYGACAEDLLALATGGDEPPPLNGMTKEAARKWLADLRATTEPEDPGCPHCGSCHHSDCGGRP